MAHVNPGRVVQPGLFFDRCPCSRQFYYLIGIDNTVTILMTEFVTGCSDLPVLFGFFFVEWLTCIDCEPLDISPGEFRTDG